MTSESEAFDFQSHPISALQQQALECAACFAANGKTLRTSDVVACREMLPESARHSLAVLARRGLIKNVADEGRRKKQYQLIIPGNEEVLSFAPPADCPIVAKDTPLSTTMRKALDCSVCLKSRDLPVTIPSIQQCNKEFGKGTAAYALEALTNQGLLEKAPKKAGLSNVYAVTEQVMEQNLQRLGRVCSVSESLLDENEGLTTLQRNILDCIRCQVARNVTPDRKRVSECLGLTSNQGKMATRKLIASNIIRIVTDTGKSSLRGTQTTQIYEPVKRLHFAKRNPGCHQEDKEIVAIYERLSNIRKRALGCLACVQDKTSAGVDLPGASTRILAECGGMQKNRASEFLKELTTEGFVTFQSGFSANEYGQRFYSPMQKGERLLDCHRQAIPDFSTHCTTDFTKEKPVNIRDTIIKCLGCLWTQKSVALKPVYATVNEIMACSGLARHQFFAGALADMERDGYLRRTPQPGSIPTKLQPTKELRILFGYNADCHFADELLLGEMVEIGATYIERPPDNDLFRDFEEFAASLDDRAPEQDYTSTTQEGFLSRVTYPRLTPEEEVFLGMIIQKSNDPEQIEKAVNRFVGANVRLATWMVSQMKFETSLTSPDDTVQAALIGLGKAARKFDPLLGYKFSTMAVYWMKDEIQAMAAKEVEVELAYIKKMPMTLWSIHEFNRAHGRHPSVAELASMTGESAQLVENIFAAYRHIGGKLSLQQPIVDDGRKKITLEDRLPVKEKSAEVGVERPLLFERVRGHMSELEAAVLDEIVLARRANPKELAEELDISIELVRRAHKKVVSLVRHPYFGIGRELNPGTFGWQKNAQCVKEEDASVVAEGASVSKACGRCAVRNECLKLAKVEPKAVLGTWGGKKASRI